MNASSVWIAILILLITSGVIGKFNKFIGGILGLSTASALLFLGLLLAANNGHIGTLRWGDGLAPVNFFLGIAFAFAFFGYQLFVGLKERTIKNDFPTSEAITQLQAGVAPVEILKHSIAVGVKAADNEVRDIANDILNGLSYPSVISNGCDRGNSERCNVIYKYLQAILIISRYKQLLRKLASKNSLPLPEMPTFTLPCVKVTHAKYVKPGQLSYPAVIKNDYIVEYESQLITDASTLDQVIATLAIGTDDIRMAILRKDEQFGTWGLVRANNGRPGQKKEIALSYASAQLTDG